MQIQLKEFNKPCECGHEHKIYVKNIVIEAGAIMKLPELLNDVYKGSFNNICIICDDNTYIAAGKSVQDTIKGCKLIQLPSNGLHADNHGVKLAEEKLDSQTRLLLAVGSGTIHDITRYIANKKGISFVSVPTAASVDGFVSTVAAMTWDGLKKTVPAISPVLVVADSDIFSKAPYRLSASGISDLLGKYTALVDWEIAHVVTGEYYCERVSELERRALSEVCNCLKDLRTNDSNDKKKNAYEQLMYALLLSGLAMQMIGNSRPASGAEHHISHLWEMEVINKHVDAYHGEKVSIGLMITTETYHTVKNALINNSYECLPYTGMDYIALKEAFESKGLYEGIIEENTPDPLMQIDVHELKQVMPQVLEVLNKLPTTEYINGLLTDAGCVKYVHEIGFDESIIPTTIRLSPYVRNRLTFMRLTKLIKIH